MLDLASADGPSSTAAPGARHIRRSVVVALAVAAVGLLVLLAPPDLSELAEVPGLVANGHLGWLAAALLFEVLSFAGYVALFRAVFVDDESRVGWRESYAITMAGLAASRVFASAGAGGVALTVWALRRLEVPARRVADRMVAFLMLLYVVYMACLVLVGLGLWTGLLPGPAPWALTLAPAVLGALAIAAGLALVRIPADIHRRLRGRAGDATALRRTLARVGHAPAAAGRGRGSQSRCCVVGSRACSARPPGGALTSPSCGRRFTPSASRRPWRCSSSPTSSACSAICCRPPAESAASRAG